MVKHVVPFLMALVLVVSSRAGAVPVFPLPQGILGGWIPAPSHVIAKSTVALRIFDEYGGERFCSGVLVQNGLLMTAAHCVQKAASVLILFGGRSDKPEFSTWATHAGHPLGAMEYASKDRLDAAIVYFEPNLIPDKFQAVELPPEGVELKPGERITVAGFGASSMSSFDSGTLKAVELEVLDDKYSEMEFLLKQTGETAACPGDSGGPGFYRKNEKIYLLGVANAGLGEGGPCGQTIIFANARSAALMSKLTEVIQKLSKPDAR